MAVSMKPVDVVVIGLGWAGSIAAKELVDAGLSVVVLERGPERPQRTDFATPREHDELRFAIRHEQLQDLSRETVTVRNNAGQTALPMRRLGSFQPGSGTGGSGVTWSGHTFRALPTDFRIRSHLTERYGATFMPDGMTVQDWGVTYDELEPHYDRFERVAGTCGKAGNIKGVKQEGGNPFEGPRSRDYPTPPMPRARSGHLFAEAAAKLGYSPFPVPASTASEDYVNPYGVKLNACRACGFCEFMGCSYGAKASPQTTILPALFNRPGVEVRHLAYVTRINLDGARRTATGVTYIDARSREVEQPAGIVISAAFAYNNARLLMLSGIGKQYDPRTGEGTLGRNYAYQTLGGVAAFFKDVNTNGYASGGGIATIIDDFDGDNFDHGPHRFVGGGFIGAFELDNLPIAHQPVPDGTPAWGSGWKRALKQSYLRTVGINVHAACQSYRGNYLDLDPAYRDAWGQPLLRMTFDFQDNDIRMSRFLTERAGEIARAMGADSVKAEGIEVPYGVTKYQTTHNVGGTAMGTDRATSVVNRFLQSWDVPNLFVMGSSVYPQNTGYNPTNTLSALTYWALDAIKTRYLKSPGPLA